jgi:hypothetical protein
MPNYYEGYPTHWVDPYSCIYIKDNVVVGMIMLDPADNIEEEFAPQFEATSWIFADDAFKAGAQVSPAIGYIYDGTDFTAPAIEELTE